MLDCSYLGFHIHFYTICPKLLLQYPIMNMKRYTVWSVPYPWQAAILTQFGTTWHESNVFFKNHSSLPVGDRVGLPALYDCLMLWLCRFIKKKILKPYLSRLLGSGCSSGSGHVSRTEPGGVGVVVAAHLTCKHNCYIFVALLILKHWINNYEHNQICILKKSDLYVE